MLKVLLRLFSLAMIVATLALAWIVIEYQYFASEPLPLGKAGLVYEIKPGTGVKQLGNDLAARRIIKHWAYLVGLARWQNKGHLIKAGEYKFAAGITGQQLLDQIVEGRVVEYMLTIVEGWSFKQFMQAVNGNPILQHTLSGLSDAQIMTQLGWPGQHPEGRFYPDTYQFSKGTTDATFLQRAYQAMSTRLEAEWQTRVPALPINTPYEVLILASIVEKETGLASERPAIAGVFMRRLQQGMRLQTDPTVIYGMGAAYAGNIRRSDLTTDNPYNTYTREGLPPTPIALPGGDAIHAVLHPEPGSSLYFVARGDGSHQFSASLDAHNAAVQKFQLQGRAAPPVLLTTPQMIPAIAPPAP